MVDDEKQQRQWNRITPAQQRQWLTVVDDEIQLERSSASKMKTRTGTCPEGTYEATGTGPVRFRSPEDDA